MNATEILTCLNAHPEVLEARLWTSAPGKERLYVTARKHNGGRNWNGGVGYRELYIDLNSRAVVAKGEAGAATRERLSALLNEMQSMAQSLEDVA